LKDGAIRNASWRERRIDFQPYPYPSYTEELIRRLKHTQMEGTRAFLDALDPATATRELVDDRFVKASVIAAGGMAAFDLPETFTRTEVVAA
jgi:NitT/TauT family transport system substrate-binding protein